MDEILEQALGTLKRKPIDGYEVYLLQSSHFEVESKEGMIETLQTSQYSGISFRILRHQRMGFSYATFSGASASAGKGLRRELDRLIEDAIGSAEATSADPSFDIVSSLQVSPAALPIFDEALEGVSEKAKIEKAKCLEAAARSVDSEKIKKVRRASYEEVLSRATLANSNGFRFSYNDSLVSVSLTAIAEASGDSEVGWDFDFSHFFNDLDAERVGQSAGGKALDRLGGKRIATGVYPVLILNSVASEFLSLVAHSFLADQIQKGKSPLNGKRGERFFSPLLTIVDDGLYSKGASTAPIDGEGTPCQRTPLVTQGVVEGFLYDRYWANRENQSSSGQRAGSTGNSRRHGVKSPPGVGISNFFIEPGNFGLPGLMDALSRGVIIDEVMGLHTVDLISGDFSLGCSGDWVEGGKKIHPVKSIAIGGNLFELFRNVTGVGADFRFFGSVGSPSLLVKGMLVSGN